MSDRLAAIQPLRGPHNPTCYNEFVEVSYDRFDFDSYWVWVRVGLQEDFIKVSFHAGRDGF